MNYFEKSLVPETSCYRHININPPVQQCNKQI